MGWEREKTNILLKEPHDMYSVRKGGGMKTESTTWHKTHNSEREGRGGKLQSREKFNQICVELALFRLLQSAIMLFFNLIFPQGKNQV